MKKVAIIFMSILIAFNLILPPDVAQANLATKPLTIAAKKAAKDIVKDTAVEMANQIVSEYLVKELLEGVSTDKGYSAVCMDGKKDNLKDCAPDKRAQIKTDLSQTDKKNLEKKVESVLERKTNTSSKWAKFLDLFIPLFLVSGAIEFISSALDGDILSFFDEVAQEALIDANLLKPLVSGGSLPDSDYVPKDFRGIIKSAEIRFKDTIRVDMDVDFLAGGGLDFSYSKWDSKLEMNVPATRSVWGSYTFTVTFTPSWIYNSDRTAVIPQVDVLGSSPFGWLGENGMSYKVIWRGNVINGADDASKNLARNISDSYVKNLVNTHFISNDKDVNSVVNTFLSGMSMYKKFTVSAPDLPTTPKPPAKVDYGKQTATDKIKDPDGKVKMKGINSFTFEYGDKEVYPSDQSTTGWKDKVTNEDTQVEEEEIVTEEVSDESGTEPGEDIDDIKDEIAKLDKNKVHHILQDKHDWHKVAKNSKDWDEIARIISKVLKEGKEGPYKSVHSKTLKIGENTIEVTYAKLKNGTIKVSDAWVRKASEQKVKNMMIKNNLNSKNMFLLKGEEIKMNNEFKNNILDGDFKLAKDIANKMRLEDLESDLMEIAFETDNIATYFFIVNMLNEEESAEIHAIGASILSTAFSQINGSYNLALNHMRKAMQLDPNNITYKEGMLLFYNIPEQLITRTEAIELAGEIIKINPENQHAKDILQ